MGCAFPMGRASGSYAVMGMTTQLRRNREDEDTDLTLQTRANSPRLCPVSQPHCRPPILLGEPSPLRASCKEAQNLRPSEDSHIREYAAIAFGGADKEPPGRGGDSVGDWDRRVARSPTRFQTLLMPGSPLPGNKTPIPAPARKGLARPAGCAGGPPKRSVAFPARPCSP